MTPEQMQHEEHHAALMAVAHSLTNADQQEFWANVRRRYPRLDGADVADVLDYTTDYDEFLNQTEPFFERFEDQVPDSPGVIFAAHAVILLGRKLTPGRVWSLLQRAGVVDPPRYPEVEAGLRVHERDLGGGPCAGDANHLLVKIRAEQGMRAAGVPEHEITEFREGVRKTGILVYSHNMADIASWVTVVDRYTELPRKVYDPTDDIALVLAWAERDFALFRTRPNGTQFAQAMANLRSHLDMRSPETIKSSLPFYGRTPELWTGKS